MNPLGCERAARSRDHSSVKTCIVGDHLLRLTPLITSSSGKGSVGRKRSGMNQVIATCWTCLLLSAFMFEPALSKGGRGGSRGSSRGSPSRSSTAGTYRAGGPVGGTRSRFRVAGRSSPVRVASAAAAGAAVALTADKWYASAFRRRSSSSDSSDEDLEYYNRTNYFDALMSRSTENGSFLSRALSVIIATLYPTYELLLDNIL
ncbi:shadow of prion protein isoform X1 [Oryzias latipes]|uniref:Shadow of prion protein n=2 Tax=Oryzias latipes TaxID=8090 RepID=A0A3B3I018_ORYLA|nr:shadow of prion protein isoform X1 [Oryzias latipes]